MSETLIPERPSGHGGILRLASDDRLARRGARGDRDAFEAIYRRYHQGLYRFCLSMVGNPEDAQDALQNTMVKVVRALPGEQRRIELKPWLYRIARNESVETLRRRRESDLLQPEQPNGAGEIADTAASRERLQALLGDLERLPERQRAALVMRELSGFEFEQIGTAFGTSAAVARQTLYEARRSLRQMEKGREMPCEAVELELSDADGRVTRRRELRAHLNDCPDCRAFRDAIEERQRELAAIAPLPLAASAGVLQGVAGGGKASAAMATSALAKSAATVAIVATVGVTAADRGRVIDLPFPGGTGDARTSGSPVHPPSEGARLHGVNRPGRAAAGPATARRPEPAAKAGPGEGEPGPPGAGAAPAQALAPASTDHDAPTEPEAPSHSSNGATGLDSPGGGDGPSATAKGGRAEKGRGQGALPEAASRGQETASGRKPPQAASPPGRGGPPASPPGGGPPAAPPGPPDTAPGHDSTPASQAAPPASPPPGGPPDSPPGKGGGKPGA